MMAVPSCHLGDLLVADRADSLLFFPGLYNLAFSLKVIDHLYTETFFKIYLLFRVKWIGS
jgi:hypothetical protein